MTIRCFIKRHGNWRTGVTNMFSADALRAMQMPERRIRDVSGIGAEEIAIDHFLTAHHNRPFR